MPRSDVPEDDERPQTRSSVGAPWRREGTDLGRLFALSDGIFAFAMTLLVLSIALPVTPNKGIPGLYSQVTDGRFVSAIEAYAIVFIILASYWRAHQLTFQYVRAWDRNLIQFNFLFLGLVVTQPFLVTLIAEYKASFLLVLIYGGISALTGFALYGCWWYASHRRRLLVRTIEDRTVRWISDLLLLTPVVFLASIPIALVDPSVAEYSWLAVFVLPIVYVRTRAGPARHREAKLND